MRRRRWPDINDEIAFIKSIALSFHATTGIEVDELYGEAALSYVESLDTYDPAKGSFSTWAFTCITNRLTDYCKQCRRRNPAPAYFQSNSQPTNDPEQSDVGEIDLDAFLSDVAGPELLTDFKERLEKANADVRTICLLVLESPHEFLRLVRKGGMERLATMLRELNWSINRITRGIRGVKRLINGEEAA